MTQKFASKMGPVFEMDGKLWTSGHRMDASDAKPPTWKRWYRVDPKTGKYNSSIKNPLEVHWLSPTKVSISLSGRKAVTQNVKDLGLYVPPASAKDVADEIKADRAAEESFKKAKAAVAGVPGTPLLTIAVDVLTDANFHSLARELLPLLDKQTVEPKVAEATAAVQYALDGDVASAAAFTAHVAKLYKNSAAMQAVVEAFTKLLKEEKEFELRKYYYMTHD